MSPKRGSIGRKKLSLLKLSNSVYILEFTQRALDFHMYINISQNHYKTDLKQKRDSKKLIFFFSSIPRGMGFAPIPGCKPGLSGSHHLAQLSPFHQNSWHQAPNTPIPSPAHLTFTKSKMRKCITNMMYTKTLLCLFHSIS